MTTSDAPEPPPAAVFSPDRTYRYALRRRFLTGSGAVNFIMLNPSTADETANDPTIRRCIGFAQTWGYAELVVTNLYALRSTDPRALLESLMNAVGPENDRVIVHEARAAERVIVAWGAWGSRPHLSARTHHVRRLLRDIHLPMRMGVPTYHMGLTKEGQPRHPLMLRAVTMPTLWTAR